MMNLIQAYRLPLGEHDPENNNPSDTWITIVDSGFVNMYNYFIEDVTHRLDSLGTGTLDQILKKFDIKIPCESCGTKEHVGVASMGNKLWDKYVCLSCSTKREYSNRNIWSVLDHQRAK